VDFFVCAIVNSSLEDVHLFLAGEFTMDRVCEASSRTATVKDFDLTFCQVDDMHLKLGRKWKRLLGKNLPSGEVKPEPPFGGHSLYYLVRQIYPLLVRNPP
jgi:hypothetical protein